MKERNQHKVKVTTGKAGRSQVNPNNSSHSSWDTMAIKKKKKLNPFHCVPTHACTGLCLSVSLWLPLPVCLCPVWLSVSLCLCLSCNCNVKRRFEPAGSRTVSQRIIGCDLSMLFSKTWFFGSVIRQQHDLVLYCNQTRSSLFCFVL